MGLMIVQLLWMVVRIKEGIVRKLLARTNHIINADLSAQTTMQTKDHTSKYLNESDFRGIIENYVVVVPGYKSEKMLLLSSTF